MSFRRDAGAATQDHLPNHELAVIFGERAVERTIARIGIVGGACPLPHIPEQLGGAGLGGLRMQQIDVEEISRLRHVLRHRFPFEFRRQPLARPRSIGGRFIEAYMRDRLGGVDRAHTVQREYLVSVRTNSSGPRHFSFLRQRPLPFDSQELRPLIAAVLDELAIFAAGGDTRCKSERSQRHGMPWAFIVERKALAVMPDLAGPARLGGASIPAAPRSGRRKAPPCDRRAEADCRRTHALCRSGVVPDAAARGSIRAR